MANLFGTEVDLVENDSGKSSKPVDGASRSTLVTLMGSTTHSTYLRQVDDYYATDPKVMELLLERETFQQNVWEPACVDSETEFFNGTCWKSISEYTEKDLVLAFDGTNAVLTQPIKYHKVATSDLLYHFHNRHLDMAVSGDHRIVYRHRRNNNLLVEPANVIFNRYATDSNGFRGKIPTTFRLSGNISVNEWHLRIAVACNADGRTRTTIKHTYELRLKKQRKIDRMHYLLSMANISYTTKVLPNGYIGFYFQSPLGCKVFPIEWIYLTDDLKRIFIDELQFWDGHTVSAGKHQYFSSKKSDVDIVQLIAHSIGISTNIYTDSRKSKLSYRVQFLSVTDFALRKQPDSLDMIVASDGYKYCFTVSTGMLILRRNNKIFITGNCGGGHLCEVLKAHGHTVRATDLYDRGYGLGGIDFLQVIETWDGDIITNPPYKYALQFCQKALAVTNPGAKIAMLLRLTFLESSERRKFFDKYPPKYVYVSSSRVNCARNGDFIQFPNASVIAYAWYIWENGYTGDTILRWFN